MKLLTNEIKANLPKIYETKEIAIVDKIVQAKFFNPAGVGTWYVVEGEEQDGDFIFFGCVELFEKEWGYFSLNELSRIKLPHGLGIERDIHFTATEFKNLED